MSSRSRGKAAAKLSPGEEEEEDTDAQSSSETFDALIPPSWLAQLLVGGCAALFFATLGRFIDGDAGRFAFQILGCAAAIHATGLLYLDSYWADPKDLHSKLFGTTVFGAFLGHFASEIIMSENTLGEAMRCFVVR